MRLKARHEKTEFNLTIQIRFIFFFIYKDFSFSTDQRFDSKLVKANDFDVKRETKSIFFAIFNIRRIQNHHQIIKYVCFPLKSNHSSLHHEESRQFHIEIIDKIDGPQKLLIRRLQYLVYIL